MILKANCKINIGLDVLRRRDDSFHDVETVMIPVRGLFDTVTVEKSTDDCSRLIVNGLDVECSADDNICIKAANIMNKRYHTSGVAITLDKRVPFGAGLGGGSADGVAVIKAMNTLFELGLGEEELTDIAASFGSDTAFFVRNTPQLCTGRGEKVSPIDIDMHGYTLVILKPDETVSTREAYAGVKPAIPQYPLAQRIARPVAEWQECIKNDFEPSVFKAHPKVSNLKDELLKQGAVYASLSGSGSAVFGLFEDGVSFVSPFHGIFTHIERL